MYTTRILNHPVGTETGGDNYTGDVSPTVRSFLETPGWYKQLALQVNFIACSVDSRAVFNAQSLGLQLINNNIYHEYELGYL